MPVQISGGGNYNNAGTAGIKRIATPAVPITGSIKNMSTGRMTSPAEPLNNPAYTPPPPPSYGYDLPSPAAIQQVQQYQPSLYQQPAPQTFAPPMEPPRPQFAAGGRQEFNTFSPEQQQMSEQQWLTGDSDYTAQTGLYQKALDDFVRRITGRIQGFDVDAKEATAGNLKNEAMSADSLGSDFGARGLSYSGLFDQSKNKLLDRYKQGRGNIEKNRAQNVQNAENEKADYTAENEISRQNARRSSLLRMAAQQQLLDSQFGM